MPADTELERADDQARDEALDISRSYIVQAPAGSGKTELLIQRYLRLLAKVDEPEEILAITFTRKAAAEMRLRVFSALQQAAEGGHAEPGYRQETSTAAAAVLERDTCRQWGLLGNQGRMRIQTLDSLNASIARMQPLSGSAGAGASVLEGHEMKKLYEQAAGATLDWLGDGGDNGRATREVLQHVDGHTGIYVAQLTRMLTTRDQWLPFVGSGRMSEEQAIGLRQSFEATLEKIIGERLAVLVAAVPMDLATEFLALIGYAIENLKSSGKHEKAVCDFGTSPTLPGTLPADLPRWMGLADFLLTGSGSVRKRVTVNEGFPPADDGQKLAVQDVLSALVQHREFVDALGKVRDLPPCTYTDEQWRILLSLFRLLPLAVAEFRRLCAARGVTDYIEIALNADAALGTAERPGDVAMLLDYQVRHILVDEMQDTSRAQYRSLEALTGGWQPGDGRTLFCVGDPMQSIYRFRHAEVAQFLDAGKSGIGAVELRTLMLRRNFRSGEHLVNWFNRAFPLILPVRNDPLNGAVSYSSAAPATKLLGQGECVVHPVFGSAVDTEADVAVSVITRLLRDHPGDTVAVLVRSRTHLPALLRELRSNRIVYQAVEIDRLTDLPEIIDILALARAIAHPGDRLAWLALLRSPWIGLDWTDVHELVRGANAATVPELLNNESRIARLSPAAQEILRSRNRELVDLLATNRAGSLHDRVERAWFAFGGPALMPDDNAVANVYHFIDALAALEIGGTIGDNAEFMSQLDTVRVSSSVPAQLKILTMHKAKGLQFDHVVLYGLGRYPASNQRSVLSWLDAPGEAGSTAKLVSPIGRRDELERDPLHHFIEQTATEKERMERGRLLYVACTRAKQSLHLVGHTGISADGTELKPPAANSLLKLLWPVVESDYASAIGCSTFATSTDESETYAVPTLQRLRTPWVAPEASVVPGRVPDAEPVTAEPQVEFRWVGQGARLAGTVVHRWLQYLADNHLVEGLRMPGNWLDLSRHWLLAKGADSRSLSGIMVRVEAAMSRVTDDPRGRWILSGEGSTELALTGIWRGRVESIVIDRLRIDNEACHWIIDYKTSSHEGGDLAGFLHAEADRYSIQLQKYAAIYHKFRNVEVRTALYFPLLGEFIETTISESLQP